MFIFLPSWRYSEPAADKGTFKSGQWARYERLIRRYLQGTEIMAHHGRIQISRAQGGFVVSWTFSWPEDNTRTMGNGFTPICKAYLTVVKSDRGQLVFGQRTGWPLAIGTTKQKVSTAEDRCPMLDGLGEEWPSLTPWRKKTEEN